MVAKKVSTAFREYYLTFKGSQYPNVGGGSVENQWNHANSCQVRALRDVWRMRAMQPCRWTILKKTSWGKKFKLIPTRDFYKLASGNMYGIVMLMCASVISSKTQQCSQHIGDLPWLPIHRIPGNCYNLLEQNQHAPALPYICTVTNLRTFGAPNIFPGIFPISRGTKKYLKCHWESILIWHIPLPDQPIKSRSQICWRGASQRRKSSWRCMPQSRLHVPLQHQKRPSRVLKIYRSRTTKPHELRDALPPSCFIVAYRAAASNQTVIIQQQQLAAPRAPQPCSFPLCWCHVLGVSVAKTRRQGPARIGLSAQLPIQTLISGCPRMSYIYWVWPATIAADWPIVVTLLGPGSQSTGRCPVELSS